MKIVAIDASGPAASCAVTVDGEVVQLIAMNQGLTHSETIMPALDACMSAAGLTCDQVDCFVSVAGPGSFTGVDAVINTGVAGGLYEKLNVGDIVISSDVVQHDVDATGFGYKLGEIPRMETSEFCADKELIKLAKESCELVNPEIQCFVGRVATGDQFISSNEKKQWIIDNFGAYCAEMEGGAMAQTAFLNKVPFVVIRAISDKADNSATVTYEEFEQQAIVHTMKLLTAMFLKMA